MVCLRNISVDTLHKGDTEDDDDDDDDDLNGNHWAKSGPKMFKSPTDHSNSCVNIKPKFKKIFAQPLLPYVTFYKNTALKYAKNYKPYNQSSLQDPNKCGNSSPLPHLKSLPVTTVQC
jgi:hypothetical protein